MLFGLRALFGLGMGGEWAAGMPLVLEHWPARLRGLVSGLMLGGWYWGYLLAAAAFQFVYPLFSEHAGPRLARHVLGVRSFPRCSRCGFDPASRRARYGSSGSASERDAAIAAARSRSSRSLRYLSARPDRHDDADHAGHRLVHVHLLLAELLVSDVPARRRTDDRCRILAAFNVGAIIGTATWGRLSEGRLGRRGAFTTPLILGHRHRSRSSFTAADTLTLILGALTMGFFGMGVWGMAPAYTVERFPDRGARRRARASAITPARRSVRSMPWLSASQQDRASPQSTA